MFAMKKTTFTLLLALSCCRLAAQCPTNVTFSTQAQVNLFAVNYPDCDSIQGNLKIGPSTDITDLSALTSIRLVKKNIVITGNSALTTLAGLDSIYAFGQSTVDWFSSLGDSLVVRNNDLLVNLSGFGNSAGTQTKAATDIIIAGNKALKTLEGLEFLTGTGFYYYGFGGAQRFGGLTVENNPALLHLQGLERLSRGIVDIANNDNLQSLEGFGDQFGDLYNAYLNIRGNDALTDLSGLDSLEKVNTLTIAENSKLESLAGLGSLAMVNGGWACEDEGGGCWPEFGLTIRQNHKLQNLTGLENLRAVTGSFNINGNEQLSSLNGIDSLRSLHDGHLEIIGNPALLNIEALGNIASIGYFISNGDKYGAEVIISGNKLLSSLNGLHQIDSLQTLIIGDNDSLTTLSTLKNLKSVAGLAVYGQSGLTSLNGLENLKSMPGNLSIYANTALTSLAGLDSLQDIGGNLFIESNGLLSLNGLNNLQSIGGDAVISDNKTLNSLNGLSSLQSVGNSLDIRNNTALTSLTGLHNLKSIGGNLSIESNGLHSLNGLENLQSLSDQLSITGNDSLISLAGLNNLQSIAGDVLITGNSYLQSLNGLERLKRLGTEPGSKFKLTISSNTNLESLYGLDSLDYSTIRELFLLNNPKLSVCEVRPVCDYVITSFPAAIGGNAPGCNNKPEIQAACQTSSSNDLSAANSIIQVYPNPATDVLNIQVNDPASWQITLYDLQGRLLYRATVSGGLTVEVDDWPAGLYVLRAVSGTRAFAGRFVKR